MCWSYSRYTPIFISVTQISRLHIGFQVPMVIPPSEGLVYRLLFAHTAMPVSRLCGALVSYKSDFEELKRKVPTQRLPFALFPPRVSTETNIPGLIRACPQAIVAEDLAAQSAQLNSYIWDFAVALWRQRLFTPTQDTTTGKPGFKETLGLSECAPPLPVELRGD